MREDVLGLLRISKILRSLSPEQAPNNVDESPVTTWVTRTAKKTLISVGLFVSTSLAVVVAPKTLYVDSLSSNFSFLHHRVFVLYWIALYGLLGEDIAHFPILEAIDDSTLLGVIEFGINVVALVVFVGFLSMFYWIGSSFAGASLDFLKCTRLAGYSFAFILLMGSVSDVILELLVAHLPAGAAPYAVGVANVCLFVFVVHHTFLVPVSIYCPSRSRVHILIGWLISTLITAVVILGVVGATLAHLFPGQSFSIGFP